MKQSRERKRHSKEKAAIFFYLIFLWAAGDLRKPKQAKEVKIKIKSKSTPVEIDFAVFPNLIIKKRLAQN